MITKSPVVMGITRRRFLAAAGACARAALGPLAAQASVRPLPGLVGSMAIDRLALGFPVPARRWRGDSSVAAALRGGAGAIAPPRVPPDVEEPRPHSGPSRLAERFGDLRRHFIAEYYPWYATSPWRHWDEGGRHPPVDIGSNYMPALGPYDSRATSVMEQHARWLAELGVGAINVSWWGRDSDIDRLVPALMDVMGAHDIQVTFHLEPYQDRHAEAYASDIAYLIRQYGDRRSWDCFLLVADANGKVGPVFKSFRTILAPQMTDCHGITTPVPDYAADDVWRRQTDTVRTLFAHDFDHVTLLADSLNLLRTLASGFDGIAIYDNFVEPSTWPGWAREFSKKDLVFSFNINPGYDSVALRQVAQGSCYAPLPFLPGRRSYDWSQATDREAAAQASAGRIAQSFETTVGVQTQRMLANARRGFFLTYVTSFNEWFEGHQFEPMKNYAQLTDAERAIGYHNAENGRYRFDTVKALIRSVVDD
ncbi:MAG: hypothetical protein ACM3SQ_20290 [Betaproteobacteria bacterium]